VLGIDVRSLRTFEPRLCGDEVEDWQVILGLEQMGADGLITCDDAMLSVAQVVAVIEQTRFSVVSCRAAGHDAVLASGLLLTHLPRVAKQHDATKPQVWRLAAAPQVPIKVGQLKATILKSSGIQVNDYKLTKGVLQTPMFP
jgi:hypothetical protein